jgi:hypothetical protein
VANGERTVRIKFDGTTKGLAAAAAAARREMRAVQKAAADHEKAVAATQREGEATAAKFAEERSKRFAKWRGELTSMAKSVLSFTASAMSNVAALNGGLGVVVGLASWAVAASGALGLIPGALAAGAAGMITWKLGADGIKQAFAGTTSTVDNLKAKVSDTFRRELVPAVREVNALLPQTTGHFQRIASAISETITRFTGMLRQKSNTEALNATLDSSAGIIRNVGKALAPLGQAFLDLAQVGSRSLEKLTGGTGALAQRFADFIRQAKDSGKIDQWIQGGLDAFKELWGLLTDVWDIAKSVFGALRDGGAGVAPILGPAIETVKRFVESPQGQETFRSLGELLSRVGDAVSRVLEPALRAVGPLIGPLSKLFGDVADKLADALAPAMEQLGDIAGPLMAALGPIVMALVDGLTPVLPALIDGIRVLGAVFVLLTPIILGAAAGFSLIVGFVMAAVQALTGDFVGAAKTLSDSWSNSMNIAGTITNTNWTKMSSDILNGTNSSNDAVKGSAFTMKTDWGGALMGMQGQTGSAMGGILGQLQGGMGQAAGAAGQGGRNASGQFGGAIMEMQTGANRGTGGVLEILRGFIRRIPDAMGNVGSLLFQAGVSIIQGLGRGIDAAFGGVFSKVGSLLGRLRGLFPFSPAKTGPFSGRGWVLYSGMAIAETLGEGVLARAGAAVAAVRGMAGQMAAAVPGGLLAPVPSASGPLVGGVPSERSGGDAGAGSTGGSGSGGARVIELTLDLGSGISERVRIEIDEAGRATARAAGAGTGGMR